MTLAVSSTPYSASVSSPWRVDFPALADSMNGRPLVFLDSAASAQKPSVVIEAMAHATAHGYANIHRGLYQYSSELTARFENVRARVATFIHAVSADEIVFTRNATEAINLVAKTWGPQNVRAGDEIILTAMEHHANIVPWQMLANATGAVIKIWPITADGRLDIADLMPLLTAQTKIVALAHVSNVLGTMNGIKTITAAIKSFHADIAVLVDGSQAVVHGPVDVTALGVDFYVFTGHKLYGPTGIGVLYGRATMLNTMPPLMGGGDMIERVSFAGTTYRAAPQRFEAGTPPIIEVIGLGAAIDYISGLGWPAITAHEHQLTDHLGAGLATVPGLTVYGPRRPRVGLFTFSAEWGHASDIAMILDQNGVAVRSGHHCAMPLHEVLGVQSTVRASLALYNNSDDIEKLLAALNQARRMLS